MDAQTTELSFPATQQDLEFTAESNPSPSPRFMPDRGPRTRRVTSLYELVEEVDRYTGGDDRLTARFVRFLLHVSRARFVEPPPELSVTKRAIYRRVLEYGSTVARQ